MSSRSKAALAGLLVLQLLVAGWAAIHIARLVVGSLLGPAEELVSPERIVGLRILDRDGSPIREPLGGMGDRGRWASLDRLPSHLPLAVLAAEDERFASHPGVDLAATCRALVQNLASMRLVSGASTITQQLVKLATGGVHRRTVGRKLFEMAASLHLEHHLTKDQILEAYLNWVPYGHLTRGVAMASETYFGKPAEHLTLSESAALAALLRGPGALDPYSHPERLESRRRWVLDRMLLEGWIDPSSHAHAAASPPTFVQPRSVFRAPHLADEIISRASADRLASGTIATTIDIDLQREAETLAGRIVDDLRPLDVTNAAVIVIHNPTSEVLAWVGSSEYWSTEHGGMNDGVTARRSPGSALKPFVYAEALERGLTPATLLEDVETTFPTPSGPYRPRNYDGLYHGPVLLRQALGSSYNVPAVWLAARMGPGSVLEALHEAGFESLDEDAAHYGAAIALGDGEVTLLELAAAYSALARGGTWTRPVLVRRIEDGQGRSVDLDPPPTRRIVTPQTAYLITSILSDHSARAPAFGEARVFDLGFPVAVKTGTSHDYRDNWAVGYTSEVTVAVWVGNFDGRPMGNISGITGAGPLFRGVMRAAASGLPPFHRPPGIETTRVCALSGALPGPACAVTYEEHFSPSTSPTHLCPIHGLHEIDVRTGRPADPDTPEHLVSAVVLESYPDTLVEWAVRAGRPLLPSTPAAATGTTSPGIAHPSQGAVFAISPDVPRDMQIVEIGLTVPPGTHEVSLLVDGDPAGTATSPPWVVDWILEPGTHTLACRTGAHASSPITVYVE